MVQPGQQNPQKLLDWLSNINEANPFFFPSPDDVLKLGPPPLRRTSTGEATPGKATTGGTATGDATIGEATHQPAHQTSTSSGHAAGNHGQQSLLPITVTDLSSTTAWPTLPRPAQPQTHAGNQTPKKTVPTNDAFIHQKPLTVKMPAVNEVKLTKKQ